jgi:hypothetical protein
VVVRVIVPAFGDEDRAAESDEDDESGEYAVPGVDRRDPPDCNGVHAVSHVHEFHKSDRDESEEVVHDGQHEIGIEHGLVPVVKVTLTSRSRLTRPEPVSVVLVHGGFVDDACVVVSVPTPYAARGASSCRWSAST